MKSLALPHQRHGAAALFVVTLLITGYAHGEEPSVQTATTITTGDWLSAGKESASDFKCKSNYVMTGRKHSGDEHGQTSYQCGWAEQFVHLKVRNPKTYAPQTERGYHFTCDKNTIMIGRKHQGDENGPTTYTCAEVEDIWGHAMQVTPVQLHTPYKESGHEFKCPINQAIAGRNHDGDERGRTQYLCAELW